MRDTRLAARSVSTTAAFGVREGASAISVICYPGRSLKRDFVMS
jgi:hypothetical protein